MNITQHWMMFGTFGEQRFFSFPNAGCYDGIVLNGSMVCYAPLGLAAFLTEKTSHFNYLIDHQMHAFQHPVHCVQDSKKELKKSLKRLSQRLGKVISEKAGITPVLPSDFSTDEAIQDLTDSCISFQNKYLSEHIRANESFRYLAIDDPDILPNYIIAPYFYLTASSYSYWLPIMEKCGKASRSAVSDRKLLCGLVISQDILEDSEAVDKILEYYKNCMFDGAMIWIDDFAEDDVSVFQLQSYRDFVGRLSESDKFVINIHGGYYSIMLASGKFGKSLTAVCHAPEFGEYRPVVPVGGGIPISRYYVPTLHQRIKYRDAAAMFNSAGWLADADTFYREVCNCSECKCTIQGDTSNFTLFGESTPKEVIRRNGALVRLEYPTSDAKQRCLRHYLNRKSCEFDFVRASSGELILRDLNANVSTLEKILGIDGISHILKWTKTLSNAK